MTLLKQLRFSEHRYLDAAAPGPISDFLRTILLVNGIAAIVLAIFLLIASAVHADECSGDTGSSAPPGGTSTSPN